MLRQSRWPETPASYGLSWQPLIYFLREISMLKQKWRFEDTSSLDGAGSSESRHQSSEAKQVSQLEGNQAFHLTPAQHHLGKAHYPSSFSAFPPALHHYLGNVLHTKVLNGVRKDVSTFLSTGGFKCVCYLLYCITNDFPAFICLLCLCLSSEAGYKTI